MISIIIPVYNAEKHLRQCIDSILIQNTKNFELIFINDGSNDSSKNILDNYQSMNQNITVLHRENKGVSSARNLGIEQAKGEWITFIDADDYIEQNYLSINEASKADLLIQDWKFCPPENFYEKLPKGFYSNEESKRFINEYCNKMTFMSPWGKFYRKDIIEKFKIRFDDRFIIGEDEVFNLNYLKHISSLEVISTSTYIYRKMSNINKYLTSAENQIEFINATYTLYKELNLDNLKKLRNIYSHISYVKDINLPFIQYKWFTNDIIIELLRELYYKHGIINHFVFS